MKKIILSVFVAASVLMSGCLKDKDFEDQKYGTQPNDIKGIGFVSAKYALALESSANPQTIVTVIVGLNANETSSTPINYTVVAAPASVLPAGVTPLTASQYSFAAAGQIPAGKYFDTLEIVIPNASLLDPLLTFGIALTITSVDAGYVIVNNATTATVQFNVKNRYDGIYSVVSGNVQRYSAPGVPTVNDGLNGPLAGNPDVTMITIGATTVALNNLRWSGGGGIGGIDNLQLTVDPVTNMTTIRSLQNATLTNWAGRENKYDPATKTFTLNFRWNPAGPTREYSVILKYKGPRP